MTNKDLADLIFPNLEHDVDYYESLYPERELKEGEKVTSGQTIGTVGNTASFEILDESHLHFEILKNGEQIDPNMYLKSGDVVKN